MRQLRILLPTIVLGLALTQSVFAASRLQGPSGDERLLAGVINLNFGDMLGQPKQQWVIAMSSLVNEASQTTRTPDPIL